MKASKALQILELIIFAGLAAIVLYQLYSVLGRRVGRQPEDQPAAETAGAPVRPLDRPPEPTDEVVTLTGLAAVRAKDPGFDVGAFLNGAKSAYEMIVTSYASGDREALKPGDEIRLGSLNGPSLRFGPARESTSTIHKLLDERRLGRVGFRR